MMKVFIIIKRKRGKGMMGNKVLTTRSGGNFNNFENSDTTFSKSRKKIAETYFRNKRQPEKTIADFLNEVLEENPIDITVEPEKIDVVLEIHKPLNKMKTADYNSAAWRALFKRAGFGLLNGRQIKAAISAMETIGWTSRNRGFGLDNLKSSDIGVSPISIKTDNLTIEGVKRAGYSVLRYLKYTGKPLIMS